MRSMPCDLASVLPGRLVLGFDATYLLKCRSPIILHSEKGVVGGTFSLSDMGSRDPGCLCPVGDLNGKRQAPLANRMFLRCISLHFYQENFWESISKDLRGSCGVLRESLRLEFLVWDPCAKVKKLLSICSVPLNLKALAQRSPTETSTMEATLACNRRNDAEHNFEIL